MNYSINDALHNKQPYTQHSVIRSVVVVFSSCMRAVNGRHTTCVPTYTCVYLLLCAARKVKVSKAEYKIV